ncbi:MAG: serine hydrolase domain-containing protein [Verrucomicrobiota bacterium]|nr:serine hydrolase domain-containing protein [Verrucomicrobiota bacterium]
MAKRVDHAMRDEIAKQELIGLAVGIIEDGQITYLKGYGLANREQRLPVTQQTMFRWASISKPLTAVAAMQLWERGELDLEGEVRQYVPEFPQKKGMMLHVRHLLCHQSGIVHYTNGKVIRTQRNYPVTHPFENVIFALDTFKESPLVNEPGEKYSYTTHGYILLSAVVERAQKKKFSHQVRDRIAKPLDMETLQPDYQWKAIPHRAVGYRKRGGKIVVSTDTDVSWKLGGGGFISNIDDLAKFATGLLNHQLVKTATRQKMWTRQITREGKQTKYALGFSFNHYRNGELNTWKSNGTGIEIIGHSGSQEKTKTWMALWPRKKMGVVLMSNSEYANPRRLAGRLLEVVMQQEP